MEDSGTVYRLCVEDIQNVANEEFGRDLTDSELEVVIEHLGDYIQWYDIIQGAISNHVEI
jgi:hypothetical protein